MKHRSGFCQRFLIQRGHLRWTSNSRDIETALKKGVRMEDKGGSLGYPVQKLWQTSEMVEMTMAQNHRLDLAQVHLQKVCIVKETCRRDARIHEHHVFLRACVDF